MIVCGVRGIGCPIKKSAAELNVRTLSHARHSGLIPYKYAGKCMVCTCIAAWVGARVGGTLGDVFKDNVTVS